MSSDISTARAKLSKASSLIKQSNYISAAQSIRDALVVLTTKSLMKAEKEELSTLIGTACTALSGDQGLKKLFPLTINYEVGKEEELKLAIASLISSLEGENKKEAQEMVDKVNRRKAEGLEAGGRALNEKKYDEARVVFSELQEEFKGDSELSSNIAEKFMGASLFDDAAQYYEQSLEVSPEDPATLNQLGIALRKIGRYDTAEDYFQRAIELDGNDPNLYFNLGRLYLDQKLWDKCLEYAEKALQLDSSFSEAGKMASYCKKQANT